MIFTGVSFDPKFHVAVLRYMFDDVITDTTNTTAELLTIIWALESIPRESNAQYKVYTDCKLPWIYNISLV